MLIIYILCFWCIAKTAAVFYPAIPWSTSQVFLFLAALYSMQSIDKVLKIFLLKDIKVLMLVTLPLVSFFALTLQIIFFGTVLDNIGRDTSKVVFDFLLYSFIWIVIGIRLGQSKEYKESILIPFILLVPILIIVAINLNGNLVISYWDLAGQRTDNVELSHLVIGEAVILIIILAISFSNANVVPIIISLGAFLLFVIGGRTNLIVFIAAVVVFYFRYSKNKLRFICVLFVFMSIIYIIRNYLLENYADDFLVNRMLLSDGVQSDESASARNRLMLEFINDLDAYFWIGNINFIVHKYGSFGSYVHNLMSAYQYFGFLGFLLTLAVLFMTLRRSWIGANYYIMHSKFYLLLSWTTLFSLISGKYIAFSLFWILIGFSLGSLLGPPCQNSCRLDRFQTSRAIREE